MAKLTERPEAEPIPNPEIPPAPEAKTIADLNIKLGQMEKLLKGNTDALEAQKQQETAAAKAQAAEEEAGRGHSMPPSPTFRSLRPKPASSFETPIWERSSTPKTAA